MGFSHLFLEKSAAVLSQVANLTAVGNTAMLLFYITEWSAVVLSQVANPTAALSSFGIITISKFVSVTDCVFKCPNVRPWSIASLLLKLSITYNTMHYHTLGGILNFSI